MAFLPRGKLNSTMAFRMTPPSEKALSVIAHAVVAAEQITNASIDINEFHCSYAHAHGGLLCRTAKEMSVTLEGELSECMGCSLAKGCRKVVPSSTSTREDKKLGRVFVNLSGPKSAESGSSNRYALVLRDDVTHMTWVYEMRHISDACKAFEQFLVDIRADGIPSVIVVVRSDGGDEPPRDFFYFCQTRGILRIARVNLRGESAIQRLFRACDGVI